MPCLGPQEEGTPMPRLQSVMKVDETRDVGSGDRPELQIGRKARAHGFGETGDSTFTAWAEEGHLSTYLVAQYEPVLVLLGHRSPRQ